MVAHAHAGFPDEACGLLGGRPEGTGELFVPTTNADASSRTFTITGPEQVRAEREIEAAGLELVGVVHSHTHTDAYPSPTDVDKGDNPLLLGWHFVIVSLAHAVPSVRAYLLDDRQIVEEPILLVG